MNTLALSRRTAFCGCLLTVAAGTASPVRADDQSDPARNMAPQPGDFLVFFGGDHEGGIIKPSDLPLANDPVLAWAFDPQKKVPRDGSRLHQILLMRFDPSKLSAAEQPRAAEGVVAYSAICTHQQCTVMDWLTSKQVLQCPCHQSEYDPRQGAKVVAGPAPRALPALPLRIQDGRLEVAAQFTDRVGGERPTG